jgi:response regulator RpfG family c-di-GMP phosphodiesterase
MHRRENWIALLVDDDMQVCRAVRRLLSATFQVRLAQSLAYAKAILETERVDVIVTEYDLGNANGLELLAAAERMTPSALRVLVARSLPHQILVGVDLVVKKPLATDFPDRVARLLRARGD